MRVAIVTCRALPQLDDDGPQLIQALAARDLTAEAAVWDDPELDWSRFDLALVRCTWDYATRRPQFLDWAQRVSGVCRLLNPLEVLRWNTDKLYLKELAEKGVPVVDTHWWDGGPLPDWPDLVVKPTVSAGCRHTGRFIDEPEQALALAGEIRAGGRQVMLQPYQAAIDGAGETALMFFRGHFSHAIRKGALLAPGAATEEALYRDSSIDLAEATPAQLEVARAALNATPFAPEELLYARVDLVPDQQGRPRVIELELTEPSLFLSYAPQAHQRFAAAI